MKKKKLFLPLAPPQLLLQTSKLVTGVGPGVKITFSSSKGLFIRWKSNSNKKISATSNFYIYQLKCHLQAFPKTLPDLVSSVGEGVGQAAKRRQWAANEEEKMRRERLAQWIGRVRGRNIVSRGQFLLD